MIKLVKNIMCKSLFWEQNEDGDDEDDDKQGLDKDDDDVGVMLELSKTSNHLPRKKSQKKSLKWKGGVQESSWV